MNIRVRNDRTVEGADTRRSLAARDGGRPAATVGLVDDATLARLEYDNMLEWLRIEVSGVAGASIRIERGLSTFLSGIAVAYLNQIVLNDGATEGGLRDAVALARERGAPYYVVGQQGRDEHLRLIAEDLGLVRDDSALPGMAIHPLPTGGAAREHDLAFVRFNRAGEKLLGATREALVGKTDFAFFPADQAKAFIEKDRETLRSKEVLDIAEEPISSPQGIRWLHTMKVPILDEEGEPEYLLGISEDITERRRAEVSLRASMEATELAHRELEAFSSSVAHDLRAPLRSIDGLCQALIDDYGETLAPQAKDYVERVHSGARRMAQLIDDLLALARVSRSDLVRSRVDVTAIAKQMAEEARKRGHE